MRGAGKLGLGTAQWGMAYGIANRVGQAARIEVGKMIRIAKRRGISLLDTARAYGEAESVLGGLGIAPDEFRIVTKTLPIASDTIDEQDAEAASAAFVESLRSLKSPRVYGLLVHRADNLLAAGGERLWAVLRSFKEQGRVEKIGASVYRPGQLEGILERYPVDLVQLPFNLYDQRFAQSGLLARLKGAGVEVHARSAFLQGLLLFAPGQLPERFRIVRDHHARLHRRIGETGLTPLEACLGFCLDQADIDKVVVGCETASQLEEIIGVAEHDRTSLPEQDSYAIGDESIIDPSMWHQ